MAGLGAWIHSVLVNEFLDEPAEWIVLAIAVVLAGAALFDQRPFDQQEPVSTDSRPRNGLGIAALALGIAALLAAWTGVGGWILGLAAEGTGLAGRRRFQRGEATNGRQARAGIVLGFLAVLVGLFFNAVWQDFSKAPL